VISSETMDQKNWCKGIPYKQIKRYPSTADNDYVAIELYPDKANCRSLGQMHYLYRIRVSRKAPAIHIYRCPTHEDLELLMRDGNHGCSGESHFH